MLTFSLRRIALALLGHPCGLGGQLRSHLRGRRPGDRDGRRGGDRRGHREHPPAVRLRSAAAAAVPGMDRQGAHGRLRAELLLQGAGVHHPRGTAAGDGDSRRLRLRLRARGVHRARRRRRGATEQRSRPRRPRALRRRSGDAELLVRADADRRVRRPVAGTADLGITDLAPLRAPDPRARLLHPAGDHAPHPLRNDRRPRCGLHPHRAGQGG